MIDIIGLKELSKELDEKRIKLEIRKDYLEDDCWSSKYLIEYDLEQEEVDCIEEVEEYKEIQKKLEKTYLKLIEIDLIILEQL